MRETRSARIVLRVTPTDKRAVKHLADQAGKTVSSLCEEALMTTLLGSRSRRNDDGKLAQILAAVHALTCLLIWTMYAVSTKTLTPEHVKKLAHRFAPEALKDKP